jgi:hypothetical protein
MDHRRDYPSPMQHAGQTKPVRTDRLMEWPDFESAIDIVATALCWRYEVRSRVRAGKADAALM